MGSYYAYSLMFAGSLPKVIERGERVLAVTPEDVTLGKEFTGYSPCVAHLHSLAYAQASAGRYPAAVATAQRAVRLARLRGDARIAAQIEARQALYRSGSPYREP